MTKKEQRVMDNWVRNYNIDLRTLPMIIHHYIDIGERAVATLNQEVIDAHYQKQLEESRQAELQGHISLITPGFVAYLLTACMGLYQIDAKVRYKIIATCLK